MAGAHSASLLIDRGHAVLAAEARRIVTLAPTLTVQALAREAGRCAPRDPLATSFSVARRTPEIGMGVAHGADARWLVASIFRRPLLHMGVGVLAGTGLTALYALGATAELTGSGPAGP